LIKSRQELEEYIESDRVASRRKNRKARLFGDECWKFQLALRRTEFHYNNRSNFFHFFAYCFYKYLLHRYSLITGFTISVNCIGPGLYLPHRGTIVINPKSSIGRGCRIHVCVNIGEDVSGEAPVIGDNVYIGPGVKIFGGIIIADNIKIGANAVVNKSIIEPNTVIGGIPAKII